MIDVSRWAYEIDRIGAIAIRKVERAGKATEYRVTVRLRCREEVAQAMRQRWGGSVSHEKTPIGQPRSATLWEVAGAAAVPVLRELLPYLKRQTEIAQNAYALLELREGSLVMRDKQRVSDDYLTRCERHYQRHVKLRAARR